MASEPSSSATSCAAPFSCAYVHRHMVDDAGLEASWWSTTAELASGPVRFKCLSIIGHTNFAVPHDELVEHYARLVGHATAGEIVLDVERVPLEDVADAWRRQAEGAGAGP